MIEDGRPFPKASPGPDLDLLPRLRNTMSASSPSSRSKEAAVLNGQDPPPPPPDVPRRRPRRSSAPPGKKLLPWRLVHVLLSPNFNETFAEIFHASVRRVGASVEQKKPLFFLSTSNNLSAFARHVVYPIWFLWSGMCQYFLGEPL